MDILQFFHQHWFLAFIALVLLFKAVVEVVELPARFMEFLVDFKHGHPPVDTVVNVVNNSDSADAGTDS